MIDRLAELAVLPLHATATAGFLLLAIPQLAWAQARGLRMADTPVAAPTERHVHTCRAA